MTQMVPPRSLHLQYPSVCISTQACPYIHELSLRVKCLSNENIYGYIPVWQSFWKQYLQFVIQKPFLCTQWRTVCLKCFAGWQYEKQSKYFGTCLFPKWDLLLFKQTSDYTHQKFSHLTYFYTPKCKNSIYQTKVIEDTVFSLNKSTTKSVDVSASNYHSIYFIFSWKAPIVSMLLISLKIKKVYASN